MYKLLSGAKSVKQYRGDENLPEAKNGMKKNCGCKHSKTRYKYKEGEKKLKGSPNSEENKTAKERYNYLKALEEKSRKQDSTYYANNIGRMIDQAAENNTKVYVTEGREGKPLRGKKSGDNTCITGVCNVAKKAGAKIPFNSALAENRNSVGDNPIETRYNPAFRDNAEKMGFKLLPQNAKLQRGDIVQLNEKGTPHHAMLYYGDDYKGSIFGNDVGNEDDGRSWFGLGPKKELGFEKRWMGPFSNRTMSSINPISKNALAYRYMGVPSKRASMEEALAYAKSKTNKSVEKENNIVKVKPEKRTKNINKIKSNDLIPDSLELELNPAVTSNEINDELLFQKNGNKNVVSNSMKKYKYKYGSGAITIPEGSAIVTANGGKNIQALKAYKKGNYKLLNKIIDDMPEDRVDKAQSGKKQVKKISGKKSDDFQEEFVIGDKRYGKELSEKDVQELYALSDADLEKSTKFSPFTKAQERAKRAAARNKQETFTFTYKGKTYSGVDGKGYSSGYRVPQQETKVEEAKTTPEKKAEVTQTPPPTQYIPPQPKQSFGKRLGNILQDIPSLAEIAARTSILGRGIDYSNIPENYLKLDKYNYASQLPATLREIQLSEQAGRETARNILGGDAGRYLAQAGNLSASRMEAANKAVIQDTLARQDILNKNVDLTNIETQTNRSLKDQYAAMRNEDRLKARAAYDEQLISLGQRIDSAAETAREMSNQRAADEQRLQVLRDLGQNYEYKNVNGLLQLVPKVPVNAPPVTTTTTTTPAATGKKGLKRVKAYKRK